MYVATVLKPAQDSGFLLLISLLFFCIYSFDHSKPCCYSTLYEDHSTGVSTK